MNLKKRASASVVALAAMSVLGAGIAEAASHTMNVSGVGAYTWGGTYELKAVKSQYGFLAKVAGTYHVTTPSDHLSVKPARMGYKQIVRRTTAAAVPYSWLVYPAPGGLYAMPLYIQTCRERWYGDECNTNSGKSL